jgi:deaminated glutathione amidase
MKIGRHEMDKLKIGIGQLNTGDDTEKALAEIERLTEEIAESGARLAVFPELSSYLSELEISNAAQSLEGNIISRFRTLAKKHSIFIHNGSFIEDSGKGGKAFNTSVFINPDGEIEAVYRKIHLFDIDLDTGLRYRESDRYESGSSIITHSSEIGDLGFSICYDLRFPELFRQLTFRGAKLIFVPAAFTLFTGKDHWEALLRARAIENQVYIAAPNQIGEHPDGKLCYGNSMIIDPWGTVIARASDRVEAVITEIDWEYLEVIRGKLPSLKNRVNLAGM